MPQTNPQAPEGGLPLPGRGNFARAGNFLPSFASQLWVRVTIRNQSYADGAADSVR